MVKLKTSLFGLGGAAVTALASQVYAACPDLKGQLTAIVVAGLMGAAALWMSKPQKWAGVKATAVGIGTAIGTGLLTKVTALCPDLLPQLPALISAGLTAGLGLWLRSPKEPNGDYVTPPISKPS
jgi:hypothetical protein